MTKRDETMFEDATDKIKKSKRNKTLVDPFGYTSHKWFFFKLLKSKLNLKQTHAMFDAVLDSCDLTSSKCLLNLLLYNKLLVIANAFQFFLAEKIFDHGENQFDGIELRRVDGIED